MRPMGLAAWEEKLGQDAGRAGLEARYAQALLGGASGLRPGRRAHDAVRTLDQSVPRGEVQWRLEADLVSFFDSLERSARDPDSSGL